MLRPVAQPKPKLIIIIDSYINFKCKFKNLPHKNKVKGTKAVKWGEKLNVTLNKSKNFVNAQIDVSKKNQMKDA